MLRPVEDAICALDRNTAVERPVPGRAQRLAAGQGAVEADHLVGPRPARLDPHDRRPRHDPHSRALHGNFPEEKFLKKFVDADEQAYQVLKRYANRSDTQFAFLDSGAVDRGDHLRKRLHRSRQRSKTIEHLLAQGTAALIAKILFFIAIVLIIVRGVQAAARGRPPV